jgi:hypothetical protein
VTCLIHYCALRFYPATSYDVLICCCCRLTREALTLALVVQEEVGPLDDQQPMYSSYNLGRNVVVSCECELILLLSVVFCLVTAVCKFNFNLVMD